MNEELQVTAEPQPTHKLVVQFTPDTRFATLPNGAVFLWKPEGFSAGYFVKRGDTAVGLSEQQARDIASGTDPETLLRGAAIAAVAHEGDAGLSVWDFSAGADQVQNPLVHVYWNPREHAPLTPANIAAHAARIHARVEELQLPA